VPAADDLAFAHALADLARPLARRWFRADLVRTMTLVGVGRIADADRSLLQSPVQSGMRDV